MLGSNQALIVVVGANRVVVVDGTAGSCHYALEFSVCLSDPDLATLPFGSVLTAVGNGVEDRSATVIGFLDDGWVSLRLHVVHRRPLVPLGHEARIIQARGQCLWQAWV
jgi:hypothetical protein